VMEKGAVHDLDDQLGGCRMGFDVVGEAPGNDGDVRLGFGVFAEREGRLGTNVEALAEDRMQARGHRPYAEGMQALLWRHFVNDPFDELDMLVRVEESLLDEALVLLPCPAAGFDGSSGHSEKD